MKQHMYKAAERKSCIRLAENISVVSCQTQAEPVKLVDRFCQLVSAGRKQTVSGLMLPIKKLLGSTVLRQLEKHLVIS